MDVTKSASPYNAAVARHLPLLPPTAPRARDFTLLRELVGEEVVVARQRVLGIEELGVALVRNPPGLGQPLRVHLSARHPGHGFHVAMRAKGEQLLQSGTSSRDSPHLAALSFGYGG